MEDTQSQSQLNLVLDLTTQTQNTSQHTTQTDDGGKKRIEQNQEIEREGELSEVIEKEQKRKKSKERRSRSKVRGGAARTDVNRRSGSRSVSRDTPSKRNPLTGKTVREMPSTVGDRDRVK